jgi:hypothetical protein
MPLVCSNTGLTSESMNPFRYFGRTSLAGIGQSQGLYLHRTAQHRKMRSYILTSNGIRTYDPSVREVQDTDTVQRAATETGWYFVRSRKVIKIRKELLSMEVCFVVVYLLPVSQAELRWLMMLQRESGNSRDGVLERVNWAFSYRWKASITKSLQFF